MRILKEETVNFKFAVQTEWNENHKGFLKREKLNLLNTALKKCTDIWFSEIIHLNSQDQQRDSTALPHEHPGLSKLSTCFWFRVVKLWVLCSEVHSDFHIWDVRYQIMKRAWGLNKSKCNDPGLQRYIYLEDSLRHGVIQEPISAELMHFTMERETMMKPSAILNHTCSAALEKCPTSVS